MQSNKAWDVIIKNKDLIYYFIHLYGVDRNYWDDCWQEAAIRVYKHLTKYKVSPKHKHTLIKQAVQEYAVKHSKLLGKEVLMEAGVVA